MFTPSSLDALRSAHKACEDAMVHLNRTREGVVIVQLQLDRARLAVLAEIVATAEGHGCSDPDKTRLNQATVKETFLLDLQVADMDRAQQSLSLAIHGFDFALIALTPISEEEPSSP
jgi:hypothetical protein